LERVFTAPAGIGKTRYRENSDDDESATGAHSGDSTIHHAHAICPAIFAEIKPTMTMA
jgi:hypothetical protein